MPAEIKYSAETLEALRLAAKVASRWPQSDETQDSTPGEIGIYHLLFGLACVAGKDLDAHCLETGLPELARKIRREDFSLIRAVDLPDILGRMDPAMRRAVEYIARTGELFFFPLRENKTISPKDLVEGLLPKKIAAKDKRLTTSSAAPLPRGRGRYLQPGRTINSATLTGLPQGPGS